MCGPSQKLSVLILHFYIISTLQAFDSAWNSAPFNISIVIELVNDNPLVLLLNGTGNYVNYSTQFFEGQNFPGFGGTNPVRLSDGLTILDGDVGSKILTSANVSFTGGKTPQFFCVH